MDCWAKMGAMPAPALLSAATCPGRRDAQPVAKSEKLGASPSGHGALLWFVVLMMGLTGYAPRRGVQLQIRVKNRA